MAIATQTTFAASSNPKPGSSIHWYTIFRFRTRFFLTPAKPQLFLYTILFQVARTSEGAVTASNRIEAKGVELRRKIMDLSVTQPRSGRGSKGSND
jgi:hypothetical protein